MQGEIRGYFELEAKELSDKLTRGVAALDGGDAPESAVQAMLRAAHTLKGAAHVVGEGAIASLAHAFEDALADYRAHPGVDGTQTLLSLTDRIAASLRAAGSPEPGVAQQQQADLHAAAPAGSAPARTVRVDLGDTARLLTHIERSGGLVTSLRKTFAVSENGLPARAGDLRGDLADGFDRLERELAELHRVALQLRLLPVEGVLLEAARTVRSTAAQLGRQVDFTARGGHERVSLALLEAMQDALLHLLRNAVAHGIEPGPERLAAGKPRAGSIAVEVTRAGREVVLVCRDDGRGIALEPIRRAAQARGLLRPDLAAASSAESLLAMLLRPGFSTQTGIDEVSGRGVGLDAVHKAMERVGGRVAISTEEGRGTSFTLAAPETLFLMALLEVTAGGVRYALPRAAIEQTFLLEEHPINAGCGMQTVLIGRETMPYLALHSAVGRFADAPQLPEGHRPAGLLLQRRSQVGSAERIVVAVDRIEAPSERLVQPLAPYLQADAVVTGAAFGPRGTLMLVLEPGALFAAAVASPRAPFAQPVPSRQSIPISVKPILVIDDSLTTRMLEQSILEAEGYEVELAVSAEQGLAMARAKTYSLFLVDVEMPGMNGFEFVALVTADPVLRATPAILVTSLNTPEHRERGRAAGAYSYIVKGEFNQQIYLDRIRSVVGGAR